MAYSLLRSWRVSARSRELARVLRRIWRVIKQSALCLGVGHVSSADNMADKFSRLGGCSVFSALERTRELMLASAAPNKVSFPAAWAFTKVRFFPHGRT